MNDHNITSNGEEELEIICHKLPVLGVKLYNAI